MYADSCIPTGVTLFFIYRPVPPTPGGIELLCDGWHQWTQTDTHVTGRMTTHMTFSAQGLVGPKETERLLSTTFLLPEKSQ